MRRSIAALLLAMAFASPLFSATGQRPNIIFILADDLGYGDLGCFGQKKILTPNLDRMAAEGMKFTQHYAGNAVCAPSRCVLLTGKHPGHAAIRNNKEVQPEGQPPLPAGTVTVAKLLQAEGYRTAVMGKWGLGFPGSEGDPLKQGFDRFFGYNCQRHAHNYYPTTLWDNASRVVLSNPPFAAHQKLPPEADPADPAAYQKYSGKDYAPDLIREQALRFIRQNSEKPFFLYFASTIPHLALQVPEDALASYKGKWPETSYPGGRGYLPHIAPRAAYAAMVSRLDQDIGAMMKLINELNLDERTIFVFSSDNGPLFNRHGGTDTDFFQSAANFRGRKGSLFEGGIRVPTIVRWKGTIAPGKTSDRITGFEDWLPTLLELAGAKSAVPRNIDGISFAPTLLGKPQRERPFLYREFPASGGHQMVRVGDWKGVRTNLAASAKTGALPRMQLYNIRDDPSESRDVAPENPKVVKRLVAILAREHRPSDLFPLPIDKKATDRTDGASEDQ